MPSAIRGRAQMATSLHFGAALLCLLCLASPCSGQAPLVNATVIEYTFPPSSLGSCGGQNESYLKMSIPIYGVCSYNEYAEDKTTYQSAVCAGATLVVTYFSD